MLTPLAIPRLSTETATISQATGTYTTSPAINVAMYLNGLSGENPFPLVQNDNETSGSDIYTFFFGNGSGLFHPGFVAGGNLTNQFDISVSLTQGIFPIGGGFPNVSYRIMPFNPSALTDGGSSLPYTGTLNFPFTINAIGSWSDTKLSGFGPLFQSNSGEGFYVGDLTNTFYNAFVSEDGITLADQLVTTNDGIFNYTFVIQGIVCYVAKWQTAALNKLGPFNSTNYDPILSDAADNTLLHDAFNQNYQFTVRSNTDKIFVSIIPANPVNTLVVFIFEKDYSGYTRLDITSDGTFHDAMYFQDIDTREYLIGIDANTFDGGYLANPIIVTLIGQIYLAQVFSLGCWSPCANLAHRFFGEDLDNG